jgi:hypothetical protein
MAGVSGDIRSCKVSVENRYQQSLDEISNKMQRLDEAHVEVHFDEDPISKKYK